MKRTPECANQILGENDRLAVIVAGNGHSVRDMEIAS